MEKRKFLLYKIYYSTDENNDELVYIGRTKQSLNTRLHGHFFKAPMMRELDINQVSRIEYACFNTVADMYVMEVVLINRYKPRLNKDDKAPDQLTISFPDVPFFPHDCPHMERWKNEISDRDWTYEKIKKAKRDLIEEHRNKRHEIFSNNGISSDEKSERWTKWLVEYYEPEFEKLKIKEELELW